MKSSKLNLDKVVKLSVIAGIVLISVSTFYYLIIFLPFKEQVKQGDQEKKAVSEQIEIENKNQEKCRISGDKAYEIDQAEFAGHADFLFEPRFTYNKDLNTCLYSGGYKKGNDWERWVKDIYTNTNIIYVFYYGDLAKDKDERERMIERIESYWEEHAELFNE